MTQGVRPPEAAPEPATDAVDYDLLPGLVGYHLRRAQAAVFDDFLRTMAAFEVTPGQFGVLTLIGANPGLSQSALARAIGIERSTMVAVIDRLQARGLVERRPSSADRRSYALVLSDAGQRLLAQLKPLVRDHDERIARNLDDDERAMLIRLLRRLHGGD
jgi:DNA-binding MarR family transcriptional regulator